MSNDTSTATNDPKTEKMAKAEEMPALAEETAAPEARVPVKPVSDMAVPIDAEQLRYENTDPRFMAREERRIYRNLERLAWLIFLLFALAI